MLTGYVTVLPVVLNTAAGQTDGNQCLATKHSLCCAGSFLLTCQRLLCLTSLRLQHWQNMWLASCSLLLVPCSLCTCRQHHLLTGGQAQMHMLASPDSMHRDGCSRQLLFCRAC